MKIILKDVFPWQTPVVTEGHSFACLESEPLSADIQYLAVPWAPIIDNLHFGNGKNKAIAEKFIDDIKRSDFSDKHTFTICQSYRYREITKLLNRIGVDLVFAPHAIDSEPFHENVQIEPLPLFPVNVPQPTDKDIWYSFVGAYSESYVSDIRLKIFNDSHPSNSVVIQRKKWQFNDAVYGEQLRGTKTNSVQSYISNEHTVFYNDIIARSRFSLCPSGAGPASIRFFESLGAGAIPVFLADDWSLPKIDSFDWDSCCIKIPESEYSSLRNILASITEKEENDLRFNCYKAFENISKNNFVKCIRNYYERK